MKKRIWELDALRGVAIIGMLAVHLVYDLTVLFDVWTLKNPTLFHFLRDWGGVVFLVLSGICVTFGRRPVQRGLAVFGCGLLISAVTGGMYLLGLAHRSIVIYFGVLHCLGLCMLLWPVFRNSPSWLLALLGVAAVAAGVYLTRNVRSSFAILVPFGIPCNGFSSADYFPLLPNLGYFLLGAVLGRTLYPNQKSLFPGVEGRFAALRFLCWCGRKSLWIYLLHQPVFAGAIALALALYSP